MKRVYKYMILVLFLFAIANAFVPTLLLTIGGKLLWNRAQAKDAGSVINDEFHNQLDKLSGVFESARDKGLTGYESFIDNLKDSQRKLDEYYHPEHKSWTTAVQDQYNGAVDKLKEWECKAEEKIHELRYGPASYSCESKPWLRKAYDTVANAAGNVAGSMVGAGKQAGEAVVGGGKIAADKAADAVGLDDLETAFNSARDEGQESLKTLVNSIKEQRAKLQSMYDNTLEKASKTGDSTSEKANEWREHFKKQAGDSLRHFREVSDDFEQRIQDFLGTDKSRWGFFSKLKFW